MGREYNSKSTEIGYVIEKLYSVNSEDDCEKICKELDKIYLDCNGDVDQNFRHEYASVSGKIRELNEYCEDGIQPYQIEYLLDNINNVYDYAASHHKPYIKNLFKLKDHIGLEAGRIALVEQLRWEITNSKESVAKQLNDLQELANSIGEQINKSRQLINDLENQSKHSKEELECLNTMSSDVANKMEDVHRDSITVLGIFASIVLSFTAGIGFSSSVLENFHQGSPYRVMAVIIGLGTIILNMISILLLYIDKIRTVEQKKIGYPRFLILVDVAAGILLILDFVAFKFNWFS